MRKIKTRNLWIQYDVNRHIDVTATLKNLYAGVFGSSDNLSLEAGDVEAARIEDPSDLAASETSLWLYDLDNGTLQQVSVGADDSGGVGYKLLRIAN